MGTTSSPSSNLWPPPLSASNRSASSSTTGETHTTNTPPTHHQHTALSTRGDDAALGAVDVGQIRVESARDGKHLAGSLFGFELGSKHVLEKVGDVVVGLDGPCDLADVGAVIRRIGGRGGVCDERVHVLVVGERVLDDVVLERSADAGLVELPLDDKGLE